MISEVLLLRREHHEADVKAALWEKEFQDLQGAYRRLAEKNDERLDTLLAKQAEIIDGRLGLRAREGSAPEIKPIQSRKPWTATKAAFEAKERQEYWRQKVKQVEEQDATSMNDKEVAQDIKELSNG